MTQPLTISPALSRRTRRRRTDFIISTTSFSREWFYPIPIMNIWEDIICTIKIQSRQSHLLTSHNPVIEGRTVSCLTGDY